MTTTNEELVAHAVDQSVPERPYLYYALLAGIYNALFGGFLLLYQRLRHPLPSVTSLDVALLGMATLRLSKLLSEDDITAFARRPVVEMIAGERRPRGQGMRWAVGKLVLCPTCTGTWVAAILGYALHLWPRHTRPFLAIMSASGMSQLTDAVLSLVYTDRDVLRKRE